MTKSYGSKSEELIQGRIPPAAMTAIGRIVRAFAEIEDIINLHIGKLAGTTEGITAIFLGRMGISAKIQMALYLAQLHRQGAPELHNQLFDVSFSDALACRNAVAHGVFLGKKKVSRALSFLTSNQLEPIDGNMRREVASFQVSDLKKYALAGEQSIPFFAAHLKLTTLREKRFQLSLLPHRKSKGQDHGSKGQKPQRRPSQEKLSKAQRRKAALERAKKNVK
jgi:hypothetical protein